MSSKAFAWDDSALVPESVTTNIPNPEGGSKEKITFYELPRLELVSFIKEGVEAKFVKEPENEDEKPVNLEFSVVEEMQINLMCKYLSISCRKVKDEEYFKALPWHPNMIKAFAKLLVDLNHIEEIVTTGGNWLMLPAVSEVLLVAQGESSESQKPTLQA